ncbi:MAG TPA: C39 family peptidase [Acetivibrio sp.]|nr:C39 family peptidase [Acetivibrio sp.]
MILIIIPFIKPIIRPVSRNSQFQDRWKDGVCLQSTGSTCGPSALATIFNYYGISKSEQEIARASFSSSSGTENWYLIRYAEKNGLKTEVSYKNSLEDVPVPSIIGTYINGRIGHFITILGKEGDRFVVGDSLKGRLLLTEKEFNEYYTFSNFVLHLKKPED